MGWGNSLKAQNGNFLPFLVFFIPLPRLPRLSQYFFPIFFICNSLRKYIYTTKQHSTNHNLKKLFRFVSLFCLPRKLISWSCSTSFTFISSYIYSYASQDTQTLTVNFLNYSKSLVHTNLLKIKEMSAWRVTMRTIKVFLFFGLCVMKGKWSRSQNKTIFLKLFKQSC